MSVTKISFWVNCVFLDSAGGENLSVCSWGMWICYIDLQMLYLIVSISGFFLIYCFLMFIFA